MICSGGCFLVCEKFNMMVVWLEMSVVVNVWLFGWLSIVLMNMFGLFMMIMLFVLRCFLVMMGCDWSVLLLLSLLLLLWLRYEKFDEWMRMVFLFVVIVVGWFKLSCVMFWVSGFVVICVVIGSVFDLYWWWLLWSGVWLICVDVFSWVSRLLLCGLKLLVMMMVLLVWMNVLMWVVLVLV